ncbi:MAG: hypothetical protein KDI02_15360 [Anaerolineae bacterium]|nr:hypothetical protein [Anaerolineae bacterium]MCB0225066.1 hypothetical protein [Anaerolineae bacterium]
MKPNPSTLSDAQLVTRVQAIEVWEEQNIYYATGGDYFREVDAAALQTIFEQIGKDLSTP